MTFREFLFKKRTDLFPLTNLIPPAYAYEIPYHLSISQQLPFSTN